MNDETFGEGDWRLTGTGIYIVGVCNGVVVVGGGGGGWRGEACATLKYMYAFHTAISI